MKKDLKKFIAKLRREGWTARVTGGGHYCLQHPVHGKIYCACTPSSHRCLVDLRARLRRRGVELSG